MRRRFLFRVSQSAILGVLITFSAAAEARAQSAGSVFLDMRVSIAGSGSDPDLADTENADQYWNYSRTVSGHLEMTVDPELVEIDGQSREVLLFRPKVDGVSTLEGRSADSVRNRFRESGEGGSWVDYSAHESWAATARLSAPSPGWFEGLQLILDSERSTWNVDFAPGEWITWLASQPTRYEGEATWEPGGPGTGTGEGWHFFTNDEADRTTPDGKFISTRYHPGGTGASVFAPDLSFLNVPATIAGTVYTGAKSADVPKPASASFSSSWNMRFDVVWTVRETLPDVELIVRSPKYDSWRPEAGPGPTPGRPLKFIARLESPIKADLSRVRVKKFSWKLVNTSREPGIAMNFPPDSTDQSPDLKLANIPTRNEGQDGEQINPSGLTSVAYVEPYDWGGWTTLNVEAELNDGRTIKGKIEASLASYGPREDIRVPRSYSDSKVAVSWQRENGAVNMWDDEDSDRLPQGKPGADGDGLSVYEEYRGFYVQGKHVSTDPRRKDLFVFNNTQGSVDTFPITERAIDRFRSVSRLDVHKLNSGELSRQRKRVNHNRAQGPTKGPQAWVEVKDSGRSVRPNDYIRSGSRPRNVDYIRVPDWSANIADVAPLFDRRGSPPASAGLEHMIVQALFQSVSVDRPGPSDKTGSFLFYPGDAVAGIKPYFELGPKKVLVIDFFGRDLAEQWASRINQSIERAKQSRGEETPAQTAARASKQAANLTSFKWLIGEKGKAHSGPEECLMRDWFADVYHSSFPSVDGLPVYRLVDRERGAEQPGGRLGSTRKGTGVNDPNRQPEPRYGNSGVGTAANRQMVVSDSAP